ncbi:MAG: NAD-dependent epimerase/dehydratase family protein [Anaerolineales bacterium]|nr:NAD-dependent epimerase/dehydratase family protein [Anaerolineales bacterium]
MSNTHVVFGSGPLGQAAARALVKRGQAVVLVNRSGQAPAGLDGVRVVAGDAYNLEFTRQICQGAAVVYQCAQPAYHEWAEKFPPLQASILEGAASAGAKLVVGENLYMYGEVDGPLHEGLPYAAATRKGRVRAEMAQALLAAHQAGRVRAASARAADFYGPEVLESSLGARAILPALRGQTASLMGALDLPHTYTFIDDFGEALAILGERDEALGQAWHVPSPPTLTQRQLMTLFFEEIGRPARLSAMGRLMLSLGGLFIPAARETVEMLYEFEKPFVVDSRRFARAFGDIATPQAQAVKATVAWYRRHLANGHSAP